MKKIKILGPVLELPDWQCCLAGSSKTATRIFIFSIVLGAECTFYLKSIATNAPTFLGYNNSVLAIVMCLLTRLQLMLCNFSKEECQDLIQSIMTNVLEKDIYGRSFPQEYANFKKFLNRHSIYIRTVSSLLIQIKLDYEPFG